MWVPPLRCAAILFHAPAVLNLSVALLLSAIALQFTSLPRQRIASLCLSAAVLDHAWTSLSYACTTPNDAMPIRFKSQPFLGPASRFSAPLCRRASGLCLCGTLLCRHCSALFSTIQCYARAELLFAQAKHCCPFPKRSYSVPRRRRSIQSRCLTVPITAYAGQISSQPYHAVSLPIYALPMPGQAVHNLCHAMLFSSMPLLRIAVQRHCPSLHCHRKSMHFLSSSPQCIAVPVPLNAAPRLFAAMPCHCSSILCRHRSSHDFAQAPLWYALPVQVRS